MNTEDQKQLQTEREKLNRLVDEALNNGYFCNPFSFNTLHAINVQ